MPRQKKISDFTQKCTEGNTKTSVQKEVTPDPYERSRNWCFTSYEESCPTFQNDMKYLICGSETCPTTGRKHWQCYTYLKNAKTWSAFQKLIGKGVHFEKCKGSADNNIKYCSKENQFQEFGDRPNQGERTDLKEIVDNVLARNTSVDEIIVDNPILYHQYGRTLEKAEDIAMRRIFRTEMTKGTWYHGDTGTGKSHMAFENYDPATHYCLPKDNGWWDGYKQQDTVIINDFRGEIKYSDLLQMVDKWPYSVPRRGREPLPFTSKHVIITSSLPPEDVYNNLAARDNLNQLYRRFNILRIHNPTPPSKKK